MMMDAAIFEASQNTNAKLPAVYQAAKQSLAECTKIDECKDWSDKAEAMASYAKQAGDETLEKYARRIRVQATRRCGELINQIESQSKNNAKKRRGGEPPSLSRKQAAKDAGLSDDQRKNAQRVANVPQSEFDEAVESDNPPTVTALADKGRTPTKPLISAKQIRQAKAGVKLKSILRLLDEFNETYDWADLENIDQETGEHAMSCAKTLQETGKWITVKR